jgi:hypothetical protein
MKYARRLVRHVTRRAALLAVIGAGATAVIVAVVGSSTDVGQIGLIVIGVLVTFVFLPEAPFKLWNVDAMTLADTVPKARLVESSRQVAKAIVLQGGDPGSPMVVTQIWDAALESFLAVLANPPGVALDIHYHISVRPRPQRPSEIRVEFSARRYFPEAVVVWFSFCSDQRALDHEFLQTANGCIDRELVDFRPNESIDDWEDRVSAYPVSMRIDGATAKAVAGQSVTFRGEGWRVVRRAFEAGELRKAFVPVELNVSFDASASKRVFPVKFSSYFSIGPTRVTFEVDDPKAEIDWDDYISAAGRNVIIEKAPGSPTVQIRASQRSVLPPGVGVVFTWN